MPRGPLPNPQRRRTNPPTIATTPLPIAGRAGASPACPLVLGSAGTAWWEWAWHTPQATAWTPGDLYAIARRAALEDDLDALDRVTGLDVGAVADAATATEVARIVSRIAALATGRVTLYREARELDKVLGLTPKAMADLRWSIDKTEPEPAKDQQPATVRRLRSVDPMHGAAGA